MSMPSLWGDDHQANEAWLEQEQARELHDEAVAARDRGIEKAERGADPLWLDEALAAVKMVAYAEPFLTSEDAAEHIERTTPEPRALGAVMRMAHDLGWIEPTDTWQPARNPTAHKRPMRVWRSLIYVERAA